MNSLTIDSEMYCLVPPLPATRSPVVRSTTGTLCSMPASAAAATARSTALRSCLGVTRRRGNQHCAGDPVISTAQAITAAAAALRRLIGPCPVLLLPPTVPSLRPVRKSSAQRSRQGAGRTSNTG